MCRFIGIPIIGITRNSMWIYLVGVFLGEFESVLPGCVPSIFLAVLLEVGCHCLLPRPGKDDCPKVNQVALYLRTRTVSRFLTWCLNH